MSSNECQAHHHHHHHHHCEEDPLKGKRESSVSVGAPKLEGQPQPQTMSSYKYMSLKRQLIKPYHPQNHVHHHYLAIEEEELCELVLHKILMGEDNKLRKSLRAEAQRELRYKY